MKDSTTERGGSFSVEVGLGIPFDPRHRLLHSSWDQMFQLVSHKGGIPQLWPKYTLLANMKLLSPDKTKGLGIEERDAEDVMGSLYASERVEDWKTFIKRATIIQTVDPTLSFLHDEIFPKLKQYLKDQKASDGIGYFLEDIALVATLFPEYTDQLGIERLQPMTEFFLNEYRARQNIYTSIPFMRDAKILYGQIPGRPISQAEWKELYRIFQAQSYNPLFLASTAKDLTIIAADKVERTEDGLRVAQFNQEGFRPASTPESFVPSSPWENLRKLVNLRQRTSLSENDWVLSIESLERIDEHRGIRMVEVRELGNLLVSILNIPGQAKAQPQIWDQIAWQAAELGTETSDLFLADDIRVNLLRRLGNLRAASNYDQSLKLLLDMRMVFPDPDNIDGVLKFLPHEDKLYQVNRQFVQPEAEHLKENLGLGYGERLINNLVRRRLHVLIR